MGNEDGRVREGNKHYIKVYIGASDKATELRKEVKNTPPYNLTGSKVSLH